MPRPRVNVAIASRYWRTPDWATPSAMMRSTLRGSAASTLSARVMAPVSRCARYSTPAGERYSTDCMRHSGARRLRRVVMGPYCSLLRAVPHAAHPAGRELAFRADRDRVHAGVGEHPMQGIRRDGEARDVLES